MRSLLARRWARFVPRTLRKKAAQAVWRQLELEAVGRQGLTFNLESRADWVIFCEIFLEHEYQPALDHVLSARPGGEHLILDLGANIGLFCYFFLNQWLAHERSLSSLEIVAVEASASNFERLCRAAENWRRVGAKVCPVSGLVGPREGRASFTEGATHSTHAVDRRTGTGAPMRYLDLETVLPENRRIDLLKCDIEGSEEDFLRAYSTILHRTSAAVVELHPGLCDAEACRQQLAGAGLRRVRVISGDPGLSSTEFFTR